MKRTKQVQIMVDTVNEYLRKANIKNQYDDVVMVVKYSLMQAECYKGFNFYRVNEHGITVLSGGEENAEFIQLY